MFFKLTADQKDDILAGVLTPMMFWVSVMLITLLLMYMGGNFFTEHVTAVAHISPFVGAVLLVLFMLSLSNMGFNEMYWTAGVSALIGIGSLWLSSVINAESGLFRSVPNHEYVPLAQAGISFLAAAAVLVALKPLISPKQV